jgi:hypothetical protein
MLSSASGSFEGRSPSAKAAFLNVNKAAVGSSTTGILGID